MVENINATIPSANPVLRIEAGIIIPAEGSSYLTGPLALRLLPEHLRPAPILPIEPIIPNVV